jgi:hypothetical protein
MTPAASARQATVAAVTKTITINESDTIPQAVARANASIVRVYDTASDAHFLALGVITDSKDGKGTIVTDADPLTDIVNTVLILPDGSHIRAMVTSRDESTGTATLTTSTTTQSTFSAWTPATLETQDMPLGSNIIAIMGKSTVRIGSGIITVAANISSDKTTHIDTSVNSATMVPGTVLINTKGEVVGMSTGVSRADSSTSFIPASAWIPLPKAKETPPIK